MTCRGAQLTGMVMILEHFSWFLGYGRHTEQEIPPESDKLSDSKLRHVLVKLVPVTRPGISSICTYICACVFVYVSVCVSINSNEINVSRTESGVRNQEEKRDHSNRWISRYVHFVQLPTPR